MIELIGTLLLFFAFLFFAAKRTLTYLHILQQEDYLSDRLLHWVLANRVFDKRLSGGVLAIGILALFLPTFLTSFLLTGAFLAAGYFEKDPRRHSKKKLAMTTRAKRIFGTAMFFCALSALWFFFVDAALLWVLNIQAIPFLLILGNATLDPFEKTVQQKYWAEASEKIQNTHAKIIGITGSFGKTSVKHMLGHILKTQAPTLMTPGSVNTPMGITRIIREDLDETHKYFIVEMGAYQPGSIAKLCQLTPPDMGIITAIGHAHYERFQTLDTVAETKFALAEAVVEKMGDVIIHERTLRLDHPRALKSANPGRFVVCGESPKTLVARTKEVSYLEKEDLIIKSVEQSVDGLRVTIQWQNDNEYALEIPLFGIHHGHNAALAFAAAVKLGIDPEDVIKAFKTMPQIAHRLEVKHQPDGRIIIDDAFNSNPAGFKAALDLLSNLKKSGRKILITPGMVELGAAHDEAHEAIGRQAGQICDIAIAVTPGRIPTFIKAFKAAGPNKILITAETFEEAALWLDQNKEPSDVILIENDLPDLYERIPQI